MVPPMSALPLLEVDVFAECALYGNPLAVVTHAQALDAATMQRLASWLNHSETAFLLPPTQPATDYQLRARAPGASFFASHPSVGAAWLAAPVHAPCVTDAYPL